MADWLGYIRLSDSPAGNAFDLFREVAAMIISQQWLKEFVDFSLSPAELSDGLTMLGLEIESVRDEGSRFKGFFTGHVVQREKHPNADKLSICTVTLDGISTRTIICGAPNVDTGQNVIVATEGAIVPNGGFAIARRKIRGIESNGMICSRAELGLGEDDGGIWVLPEHVQPGIPLADFLGIADIIYEVGITPNRADCLSHLGIAREIQCLLGDIPGYPAVQTSLAQAAYAQRVPAAAGDFIDIELQTDACQRYAGLLIKGVKVGESPEWLRKRLESVGIRPRNTVVDATNYVLMECGQPLHAFDADTIAGRKIIVKMAENNQKFITLDDKERSLDSSMMMICDAEKPVAIAGVMGGQNSEISDTTVNVFIESAWFNPSSIRRTARRTGISSDASYRFERGVDIQGIPYAAMRAAQLIIELSGGIITGDLLDIFPGAEQSKPIAMRSSYINRLLGIELTLSEMANLLRRTGCTVQETESEQAIVYAPSWRVDIHNETDIAEEIARIYNYDNIPVHVNAAFRPGMPIVPELSMPAMRDKVRKYFVHKGFNELVTYSFLDPQSAAFFTDNPIKLANPLGEEFSVMRPSLLPASLRIIARNLRAGQQLIRVFDTGRIFIRDENAGAGTASLAGYRENEQLLLCLAGQAEEQHWSRRGRMVDFYDIKGIAQDFLEFLNPANPQISTTIPDTILPAGIISRNAVALYAEGRCIGFAAQLMPAFAAQFGCSVPVFVLQADLNAIYALKLQKSFYQPVNHYPPVQRDAAFISDISVPAGVFVQAARQAGTELLRDVQIFDVFTGATIGENRKSTALSFTFQAADHTLVDEEIATAMQHIIAAVEKATGGSLRGI